MRSTLPFGVSGSASKKTMNVGTIGLGNRSRKYVRSEEAVKDSPMRTTT